MAGNQELTRGRQWRIGDVTITRIVEMEVAGGSKFILPDATREACKPLDWLAPHFMDGDGNLIMSIHALVVDTGERRIVVDTCIGNDKERSIPNWSNLQTSFLADLEAAGYPRESIDTVLCTHMHVDHVGWNTMLVDGKWVPTFPNARYLLAEKEFEYWNGAEADALNTGVMEDSVTPVVEAGLVDLVDWEHQVCSEVSLKPTPGHTPGHVSILIRSEGQTALITGDCFHHPCQMTRVEWCSSADFDQGAGQATREKFLDEYSESDVLIIGTHFATPTAGHVKPRSEGGYWLDVG
ncbi:MAG: MBL fold metallo-hydrolase [Gammaproteobacteria bacterium]|nr:MAG: MBL fold metallo-hydrolase [Gammaproteobacteria bacterium]